MPEIAVHNADDSFNDNMSEDDFVEWKEKNKLNNEEDLMDFDNVLINEEIINSLKSTETSKEIAPAFKKYENTVNKAHDSHSS